MIEKRRCGLASFSAPLSMHMMRVHAAQILRRGLLHYDSIFQIIPKFAHDKKAVKNGAAKSKTARHAVLVRVAGVCNALPDTKHFYESLFVQVSSFGAREYVADASFVTQLNKMTFNQFLKNKGLMQEFSLAAADEVNRISSAIPEREISRRRDLRGEEIYTIDGADAKDLDDAVSVRKLKNKHYILGVHIADVSHYVTQGCAVDIEAYQRGTSVYLTNGVIPMLPTRLSNDLCSLNDETDKLAVSVFIELDPSGTVLDSEVCESVIRSCGRMTYDEISALLNGDMAARKTLKPVIPVFETMRELALLLRDRRIQRGSLDFNLPEPKIVLDMDENPISVAPRHASIADIIIEEFMLLANETVATRLHHAGYPLPYRVHELPSADKLEQLRATLKELGIRFNAKKFTVKNLQSILFDIKGTPREAVVSASVLRSLMKARYCEINHGHFALAAELYCHFTSPIRRYPDLIVHRILKESMRGEASPERVDALTGYLCAATRDASDAEAYAVELEREWTSIKLCEFMRDKVGQEFIGTICSVTSFGVFVALDNTVEGLIHVTELADDYYEYSETSRTLMGRRTGRVFRPGDQIKVRLLRVDTERLYIDFVPVYEDNRSNGRNNGAKRSKNRRGR